MAAVILKWVIIVSAVVNFGFMAFDGTRALTVGDYVRPKTGQYAGQLGPWSIVVRSVGIDPESTVMKTIFVVLGTAGLFITYCFAMDLEWAWRGLLIMSICTLWYLVPGTGLSILQIALLIILKLLK